MAFPLTLRPIRSLPPRSTGSTDQRPVTSLPPRRAAPSSPTSRALFSHSPPPDNFMKSLFFRRVQWVITDGLVAVAMYFALVENVVGAERVVEFTVGFSFVLSWFFLTDSGARIVQEKGPRVVASWISVTYDIAAVIAFAWFGWMWCAVAWAIAGICSAAAYRDLPALPPAAAK